MEKPLDYHSQSRPEMIARVPASAQRVLELGCGEGHFGAALKSRGVQEVWGLELDPHAAAHASQQLDRVLTGDLAHTLRELPDQYFDTLIANDVLEHLADPTAALNQLKSKLKPGATLVTSIPNVRFFWVLWGLLIRKEWKYENAGVLDQTHLRFFTQSTLREWLEGLGFKIHSLEGIHPIRSWKFELVNLIFLGSLSDARYPQFACVARVPESSLSS